MIRLTDEYMNKVLTSVFYCLCYTVARKARNGNLSKTKDRIRESNLRYKQSLGQNFI